MTENEVPKNPGERRGGIDRRQDHQDVDTERRSGE